MAAQRLPSPGPLLHLLAILPGLPHGYPSLWAHLELLSDPQGLGLQRVSVIQAQPGRASELARPLEVTLFNPLILPRKLGPGEAHRLAYDLLTGILAHAVQSLHSLIYSFVHSLKN